MTPATATKLHGDAQLEHICSFRATIGTPEIIGPLAEGLRLNFYMTGGEIFGPAGRRPSRWTKFVGRRRTSSMKAIHLTAYGNPAQNLQMVEVPEPDAPSTGEALVRTEYALVDYSDLLLANGVYFLNPQLPSVIGGEGAGIVEAVGPGVTGIKIGDRVTIPFVWQYTISYRLSVRMSSDRSFPAS
jgi:hypothetical protein